jgi:hypothetical protein
MAGCRAARPRRAPFACRVAEWLNRNPVRSAPGRCLGCGSGDHGHDPLLPLGIKSTGHAWLHSRCWPAWYASRKAEAVAALAAIGIVARREQRRLYIAQAPEQISPRELTLT